MVFAAPDLEEIRLVLQVVTMFTVLGTDALHFLPKGAGVIHVPLMRQFVDHHIIHHFHRQELQADIEVDHAAQGTAPPECPLIPADQTDRRKVHASSPYPQPWFELRASPAFQPAEKKVFDLRPPWRFSLRERQHETVGMEKNPMRGSCGEYQGNILSEQRQAPAISHHLQQRRERLREHSPSLFENPIPTLVEHLSCLTEGHRRRAGHRYLAPRPNPHTDLMRAPTPTNHYRQRWLVPTKNKRHMRVGGHDEAGLRRCGSERNNFPWRTLR